MPNARPEVARLGWRIYSTIDPRPSRDEINAELGRGGSGAISVRTYRHYRNLERHGYSEYMPINELDVRIKIDRLRQAS